MVTLAQLGLGQCSATFLFHPWHTLICQTHDGTPHNVASRKGGTKLYMAINMYLHINICPVRIQAYENKKLHMFNKTIDAEPVCVCVCVCVCVFTTNSNYER
jgi:hypothetical protein